jgi:hypothetical protein
MTDKLFVTANNLVRDSFCLARGIHDSGYRPDVLLVIWRGGTPVGMVIHEFFRYKGTETYHAVLKSESYVAIGRRTEPEIENMDAVMETVPPGSQVLLVDDIFDSGCTICAIRKMLEPRTPNIRVATLYYKPRNNRTELVPDYFLRETDQWVVFPHELMGLSPEEIGRKGDGLLELLGDASVTSNQ